MTNKLDALREMSVVVADTGDMESIKTFKPTDFDHQPDADPESCATAGLQSSRRRSDLLGRQAQRARRDW